MACFSTFGISGLDTGDAADSDTAFEAGGAKDRASSGTDAGQAEIKVSLSAKGGFHAWMPCETQEGTPVLARLFIPGDTKWSPLPEFGYRTEKAEITGFYSLRGNLLDGVREDVRAAVEKAADVYRSLGAEIVRFKLPALQYALPVYYILACAEASSNLGRYDGIRYGYKADNYTDVNDMIKKTRSNGFGDEVKKRILLGTYVLSSGYYDAYYKKAQNLRGTIVKAFRNAFESCDVILAPTVPMTAFENGRATSDPIETYLTDICTVPVNICGLPAVSVPCGFGKDGLPIGMQLIGNSFDEATILNAAWQYENAAADSYRPADFGVKL